MKTKLLLDNSSDTHKILKELYKDKLETNILLGKRKTIDTLNLSKYYERSYYLYMVTFRSYYSKNEWYSFLGKKELTYWSFALNPTLDYFSLVYSSTTEYLEHIQTIDTLLKSYESNKY